MTQPGRAAIEIVGDVSKLGRRLERDVQRAIDRLDVNTDRLSKQLGDGFEKGAQEGAQALSELEPAAVKTFDKIKEAAEDANDNMVLEFEAGGVRISKAFDKARKDTERDFDGIGDSAKKAKEDVETNLVRPMNKAFTTIGESIVSIGSAIVGLGASAPTPAGLIAIGASLLAIVALVGPLVAVAAALADLVGLIAVAPAGLAVLVATMVPVTLAFQGFGEAIKAVLEGDPEKITEALEGMAPAAAGVVREFQKLVPQFRDLQRITQQAFFEPLRGDLTALATAALPILRTGLTDVANSIGGVVSQFAELVGEQDILEALGDIFESTGRIIDRVGPSAVRLFGTLIGIVERGLPFVERLADGFAAALDRFSEFLSESLQTGSFEQFFQDAVDTVKELVNLGKALGSLFATIFGATDEAGRGFLATLTDLVTRLDDFFKSAEGQRTLDRLADSVGILSAALGFVVDAFIAIAEAGNDVEDAFVAVSDFFDQLGSDISIFWSNLVTTVETAVGRVVTFFQELPGKILSFIQSIPSLIAGVIDSAIDQVIALLGFGIAAIIVSFTDLPRQLLGALESLRSLVGNVFDSIRTKIGEAITASVEFIRGLPDRIREFFGQAASAASNKINELVGFVRGLPGRILGTLGNLGSLLLSSGQKIIQGLIDGIKSRIGQLKQSIADAVQQIRDHLPFSPAKTGPLSGAGSPDIAGATIAEMIAQGIDSQLALISAAAARAAGSASPFGPVADAGVAPLAAPVTGSAAPVLSAVQGVASEQQVILVQIGNEEIEAFIDKRVERRVAIETRRLLAGTRG